VNATLYRNATYRFRFLNAHFDSFYTNISFAYFSTTVNNLTIEQEAPLQIIDYALFSQNMTALNFTVIGADSTLFS
jgi:hypothetical protein